MHLTSPIRPTTPKIPHPSCLRYDQYPEFTHRNQHPTFYTSLLNQSECVDESSVIVHMY